MKTKIRLRQGGVKNHPLWHIVVQGEKKNLRGKYIERIGYWMPRHQKTYKRGVVLNKHKMRYWLSVGAVPTGGVNRLLEKFDFFPKRPTPHGIASVYEKPEKYYHMQGWKKKNKPGDNAIRYQQLLQGQMNIIERQKRVQAEAMANLGLDNQIDIQHVKTDDIESEEGDIFERVKKFEELQKRFAKHRKEQHALKGNDLRYNVYLNKIHKLTRMDLGLDVEGYKDYVHNLKAFANYNEDYQIFANDQLYPELGTNNDPSLGARLPGNSSIPHGNQPNFDAEGFEYRKINQRDAELFNKLRNTVGKIHRGHQSVITQEDRDIIEDFASRPDHFLDYDYELALDIKHLYDKRIVEQRERKEMGMVHIRQVSDADLEACGVSKREFALIRKLLDLDNDIFAYRDHREDSAFYYAVDLSKYDQTKIPKDCKEMLYRPNKMRKLYERYWQVASHIDKRDRATLEVQNAKRYYPRKLAKTEAQYELMDRMVEIVDLAVADFEKRELKELVNQAGGEKNPKKAVLKLVTEIQQKMILQARGKDPNTVPKLYFKDQFEYEAEKILQHIRVKEEVTLAQMQFLLSYNEVVAADKQYFLEKEQLDNLKIWEPVEHEVVEDMSLPIGQVKDPLHPSKTNWHDTTSDVSDEEGKMTVSSEEERVAAARNRNSEEEDEEEGTTTEDETTTDGDGLTQHRFENVSAMTPEEYMRYKRGIKEEVYGPEKRKNTIVGLHNIGQTISESDAETGMDPSRVTYEELHREGLLNKDTNKLDAELEDLEELQILTGTSSDVEESKTSEELITSNDSQDSTVEEFEDEEAKMEMMMQKDKIQRQNKKLEAMNSQMADLLKDDGITKHPEKIEQLELEIEEYQYSIMTPEQQEQHDREEDECIKKQLFSAMLEEGEEELGAMLPAKLMDKINDLQNFEALDFEQKSECLSYLVDRMKADVIASLVDNGDALEKMDEQGRKDFYYVLDDAVNECSNQLFVLHQQKADKEQGKLLTKDNELVKSTIDKINACLSDFDLIKQQMEHLDNVEEINENFEGFARPLSTEQFDYTGEFRTIEALQPNTNSAEDYHEKYDEAMTYVQKPNDMKKMEHWQELDPLEAKEIMDRLTEGLVNDIQTQEDIQATQVDDMLDRMYLTKRYQLNYAKLFHGYEGGYPIDKLKQVLTRIREDQVDMLHPFLDPEADEDMEDAIESLAMERLYKRTGDEIFNEDLNTSDEEASDVDVEIDTTQKTTERQSQSSQEYDSENEDSSSELEESKEDKDYISHSEFAQEVLNTDGEIDEDKLAEQVQKAKDLNLDQYSDEEMAHYLKEIRDEFVEDAERERDEEQEDEEQPDIGLNRYQKKILDEVDDPVDQLIIKEILLIMAEKQDLEAHADYIGKKLHEDDGNFTSDEEDVRAPGKKAEREHLEKVFAALEERFKNEYGYELNDITDEEEFKVAYVQYIKKNVRRVKKSKYKKSLEDIEHDNMMRDDPIYRQMYETFQGAEMPISLVSGQFIPNKYGREKEMKRIESNVGRYPMGYRHYENYHNYKIQKPDATIVDYQEDVNSPISFEEFLDLKKRSFVYECNHNPVIYYEQGFDDLDPDNEQDRKRLPEYMAETGEFLNDARELFNSRSYQLLMEKKHFTKVEALEMFTNFWSFGRGVSYFPRHNIYVPTPDTIMPRPKFVDMDKWDDQEGKDWTYRTRDKHAPQQAFSMPNTVKPSPMSPAPPKLDKLTPFLMTDSQFQRHKWNRYRRLSKSKRDSWTSINMPSKWKSFSTSTRNSMSEEQEQRLMQDFNSLRPSVFDKPTYNPFKILANHLFNK